MAVKKKPTASAPKVKEMGRYIVADPKICHGKPTFRGTRIMVDNVLEMIAAGMSREEIVRQWRGDVPLEAITEAAQLAREAFLKRTAIHGQRKAS